MISGEKYSFPDLLKQKEMRSILKSLSDAEIEELCAILDYREWPSGTAVITEGEPDDFLGFLIKGKLAVKRETSFSTKYVLLAILEKGAMVGEFSWIRPAPRAATVTAIEDSGLLTMTSNRMEDLMINNPVLGIKLLKHVLLVVNRKYRNVIDRLAQIL